MEEVWERLHALESQIVAHNEEVDKISPKKTPPVVEKPQGEQMGLNQDTRSRSNSQLLELRKEAKEKEFKIAQLERDLASMENIKDQNQNLKAQVALLTEKLNLKEQELKEKDAHLKELESTVQPTLVSYEGELGKLRSLTSALQRELSAARQSLAQKEIIVADLTQTNANKDERSALIARSKSEAEQQVEALSSATAKLQDEVVAMTHNLRDKELIVDTLEEDNNKLRAELQKAMEALEQCQSELKLIPKLKGEVSNCEKLISTASREVEEQRSAINRLVEERNEYASVLEELKQVTEDADPVDFVHRLQSQLLESTSLLGQIKSELTKRESIYKDQQLRSAKAVSILTEAFTSFSRMLDLESLPILPKLAVLPEGYRELIPTCDQFRTDLEVFRNRCLDKIRELEGMVIDHDAKAELVEGSQKSLKSRLEDLSIQISEQETLYHELAREKERTETELIRQVEGLRSMNQQSNAQMEQLKTAAERLSKAVQPLLVEPLVYGGEDRSSRDLPSAVQMTLAALRRLDGRVRELETQLQDAQRSSASDKAALEDCSQNYALRFQDMSRQIRDLTSAIDQSEDSSKGILQKYKQVSEDLQTTQIDLNRTKDSLITTQMTCKHYVALIEVGVFCLGKTVEKVKEMQGLKKLTVRMWSADSRNMKNEWKEVEDAANAVGLRLPRKATIVKVRAGTIAVLATVRLWNMYKKREDSTDTLNIKGVVLPLPKKHFLPTKLPRKDTPIETLHALLTLYEKSTAEHQDVPRLSQQLLLGLSVVNRKHPSPHFSLGKKVKEYILNQTKRLKTCESE